MTAERTQENPVLLSPDLFHHEATNVQFLTPDVSRLWEKVQSRSVSKKGLLIEIYPPLRSASPMVKGDRVRLMLRLPYQEEFLTCEGIVTRILPDARDRDSQEMSILAIRFVDLDVESARKLDAHDLATESRLGRPRSARVPVRFPVEPANMDVIAPLTARDLSMSGMFVATVARFPIGKNLQLGFRLPFQKRRVVVSGAVIWLGEKPVPGAPSKLPGFGFEFQDVPSESRTSLAMYYARFTIPPA